METFNWQSSYEINVEEIDNQHKKLLNILNKLITARNSNEENKIMGDILKELVEYTHVHFNSEETHMQKAGYPNIAEHKSQHKVLINQIVTILKEIKEGKTEISDELFGVLKNWIFKHVLDHDKEYGNYLRYN